jgi:hypothetical protein
MKFERDETVLSLTTSSRVAKSTFIVRLIEGYFSGVSRFISLNLYIKIDYGEQIWKSGVSDRSGSRPKWNSFHQFEVTSSQHLDVTVFDKNLLFADSEIGRCRISLAEVASGHQTEWWTVLNASHVIGRVLLTFDMPNEENLMISTHSSHSSLDIREESFKVVDFEFEKESVLSQSISFKREKGRNKSTVQEENLEKLKIQVFNESGTSREQNLRILYEQAKKEDFRLKKEKSELRRFKEVLKKREQVLNIEESTLETEKSKLSKEKEEIQAMKSQINHDTAKLKQEKQKLNNDKRDIDSLSKELGQVSKRIQQEKTKQKQSSLIPRPSGDFEIPLWAPSQTRISKPGSS